MHPFESLRVLDMLGVYEAAALIGKIFLAEITNHAGSSTVPCFQQ